MNSARATLLIVLAMVGCGGPPSDSSPRWVRVARDANYTIYIDTGRVTQADRPGNLGKSVEVTYRTDHAIPRLHGIDKKPFNREIVHSIVRCDSLLFRVVSVDMSMGSDKPIALQRLTPEELQNQKWKHVELGTSEELAARAACHFVLPPGTVGTRQPPPGLIGQGAK